jgi:hypothetical protein
MDFAGVGERGAALQGGVSVVDPYYEEPAVFDTVLAMIIRACDGLVAALTALRARGAPQSQWTASLSMVLLWTASQWTALLWTAQSSVPV